MSPEPAFDLQTAHKYFAVQCFNQAWDLLDKPARTPEEDETMIRLSLASTWHWSQRTDCTAENYSIGYWQTARIYAVLGQPENARRYAQICLDVSRQAKLAPFYTGYAYEALARAEMAASNQPKMEENLRSAHSEAEKMTDLEAKKMLLDDLATIQ